LDCGFAACGNQLSTRKILDGYNQHKSVVHRANHNHHDYDNHDYDHDHNYDNQYDNNDSSSYSLQFNYVYARL
jgi:hypothetical protein